MNYFSKTSFKRLVNSPIFFIANSTKKFVIFLGPPGCGLGTYAELLCKDLEYNRISISEEIRKLMQNKSTIKIDENMLKENLPVLTHGKIVTNELAIEIIKEKLKEKPSIKGVTIGGFPRSLSQIDHYEKYYPVDLAIYLRVNEDILMETLLGRRTCFKCGVEYNLCEIYRDGYEMDKILPKNEGRCDACNEKLVIRPDDNIQTIYSRIYNYRSEGKKVLEYYKAKKIVLEYEPKKGIKDYPPFLEKVKNMLKI